LNKAEEFKSRIQILDICSEYTNLHKVGSTYRGRCPFRLHKDENPSFYVYPMSNSFYCYGCDIGGDIYTFVMEIENCNFYTALRHIAERLGEQLFWSNEEKIKWDKEKNIFKVLTSIANYYREHLSDNGKTYLLNRGLSEETIEKYWLGETTKGKGLWDHLRKLGYSKEAIYSTGIFNRKMECFFKPGMITFPNFSRKQVVYISARDIENKKYILLPRSALEIKDLYLGDAIHRNEVIICEGQIDTLTLRQHGYNSCGIYGSHLWKDEWTKILGNKRVYLAFDNDEAGRKAVEFIGKKLGPKTSVLLPPEKSKDWNDYIENFSIFEDCKNKAPMLINWLVKEYSNLPECDKLEKSKELYELIEYCSKVDRSYFSKQIKKLVGLTSSEKKENPIDEIIEDSKEMRGMYFSMELAMLSVQLNRRNSKGYEKDTFFITSKKEFRHWKDERLEQKGFFQKARPIHEHDGRWRYKDIKNWIASRQSETDPISVIDELTDKISEYIDFRYDPEILLVACWIIGTYMFPIFSSYPYLFITGEKASGKTKLLDLISLVAYNPINSVSITPAALFRILDVSGGTLMIDEAETLSTKDEARSELISILNAGYRQGGTVHRCRTDTHDIESFNVYSPKIISAIGSIETTLLDRCIKIVMQKSLDNEKMRKILKDGKKWWELRDLLHRFTLEHYRYIIEEYKKEEIVPKELRGREVEKWRPILAINAYVLEPIKEQLEEYAVKQVQSERKDAQSRWFLLLLQALRNLANNDWLTSKDIKEEMKRITDEENIPTTSWISRKLTQYQIGENEMRGGRKKFKISEEEIENLLRRYE